MAHEAWVKKSELEDKEELFGDGKGFDMGCDKPKCF